MFNHLYRFCSLFIFLPVILLYPGFTLASSAKLGPIPGLCRYDMVGPDTIGATMTLLLHVGTGFNSDKASLSVSWSEGVEWLSKELYWSVNTSSSDTFNKDIKFRINKPGRYTITASFQANVGKGTPLSEMLAAFGTQTFYIYAHDGVLTIDVNEKSLHNRIQDSLCFTTEEIQRRVHKRYDSLQTMGHKDLSFTSIFWALHPKSLLDNTINEMNYHDFYNVEQCKAIDPHYLTVSKLRSDCDALVARDTVVNPEFAKLSPKRRYQLANLGLTHLKQIVKLDHQIIETPIETTDYPYLSKFESLLAQRREMLKQMNEEMESIAYPKQ